MWDEFTNPISGNWHGFADNVSSIEFEHIETNIGYIPGCDSWTAILYDDRNYQGASIARRRRKLDQINRVRELQDLSIPPGNRLERLRGDRRGQHSIRINQQYRTCFRWEDGHAFEVQIIDYP